MGYNWKGVACICFDTEHSFIGYSKKWGYNWEGVACICFDTEHSFIGISKKWGIIGRGWPVFALILNTHS